MSNKQTVTGQEIVDFVFKQPRDRKFNMRQAKSQSPCGCVMVQYGKEELKLDNFDCGCSSFSPFDSSAIILDVRGGIFTFLGVDNEEYTYGELQDMLTARNTLPTKTQQMKTVNQLRKEGFKVNVHHLRFRKGRSRREAPVEAYLFEDTDDINPKGGLTIISVMGDAKIGVGKAICAKMDHYNKKEGVQIALQRAIDDLK